MAGRIVTRTVVNPRAIAAISSGLAEGLGTMAESILARTNPPDDPATSAQIAGGYGVWVDGQQVAGSGDAPHGVTPGPGVTLVVGYDFPARFNEIGSAHQPGRPFFTPEVLATVPGAPEFLRGPVQSRLAGRS